MVNVDQDDVRRMGCDLAGQAACVANDVNIAVRAILERINNRNRPVAILFDDNDGQLVRHLFRVNARGSDNNVENNEGMAIPRKAKKSETQRLILVHRVSGKALKSRDPGPLCKRFGCHKANGSF
jgi:hypothetical protein